MIAHVTLGALEMIATAASRTINLTLSGQADPRDGSELTKHLLGIHQDALAAQATLVLIDFSDVGFMNSSALGAFVRWLGALEKTALESQYRISFKGSRQRRWQRGSLSALANLAPERVTVEFE